jgi:hypothetical protein
MAVDDAGRGRVERGDAGELGLERQRLRARHPDDVGHAIGMRFLLDAFQLGELRRVGGDDELARAPMRHAVGDAVFIKERLSLDAGVGLEGASRVVDAGVDDLGVARAGVAADRVLGLQHDHFAPRHGEGARDGKAHHARADDYGVKLFHG